MGVKTKTRHIVDHVLTMMGSALLLCAGSTAWATDVAQVGDTKYESIGDALSAVAAGQTITLTADCTFDATASFNLPANVKVDGAGHKLSGDVCFRVNADGGTIQNVVFEKIHNAKSNLSAIYASDLARGLIVTGCTFDNCDWDAIQATPIAGSGIIILGNTFRDDTEDGIQQQRFVHIQSAQNVDFGALVADNVMLGDTKQGALEAYWFADAAKVKFSGNYIEHDDGICILQGTGVNACEMIYPRRASAEDPTAMLDLPVAAIKTTYNATFYGTLAEAVDAAPVDGTQTTITLLSDVTGPGVKVAAGKNIVFDLKGHTYTVSTTVGSKGTETNGFQLLKDSTVKFVDGALESETAKILIQNYCDLTLDHVVVNGTKNPQVQYAASNNFGSFTTTNGSEIHASEGQVAFDVWYGMSAAYDAGITVNIGSDTVLEGKIEYGAKERANTTGWTDKAALNFAEGTDLSKVTIADGNATAEQPNIKLGDAPIFVAKVNGTYCSTLADAIAMVKDGVTITMLADVMDATGLVVDTEKTFTVDFNGHIYEIGAPGAGSKGTETNGFQLRANQTVTFKNGTIRCSESNKTVTWPKDSTVKGIAMLIQNYANLTLEDMTIDGANIAHNGGTAARYIVSCNSGAVAFTGSTSITAADGDVAFDSCKFSVYEKPTVTVNTTGTITGIVELSGGNVNLTAGTLDGSIRISGGLGDGTLTKTFGFAATAPADYKWDADGTLVAKVYVVQIGETKYETLAEAVDAAPVDGTQTTITLLSDVTGPGVKVAACKNIVFDLKGHTYTVSTTVGSKGTETNGFQLLKDSTVKFVDGAIESATAKILIQNYCDLTLDHVVVNGTKNPQVQYAASNNFGSFTTKNGTKIYASEGQVAFDVWYGMSEAYDAGITVNIGSDTVLEGKIEYGAKARANTTGWTDKAALNFAEGTDLSKVTIVDGNATAEQPHIKLGDAPMFVAKAAGMYYPTFVDAVVAAKDGETVMLLADVSGSGVMIKAADAKSITIDLNQHTYTLSGDAVGSAGTVSQAFHFEKGCSITIKNGTLNVAEAAKAKIAMLIQNYCDLTLTNVVLDGTNCRDKGYTLSNNNGTIVLGQGTVVTAPANGIAFDVCRYASYPSVKVTVDGATINGNIELSASSNDAKDGFALELKSGTVNGTIKMSTDAALATVTKAEGFDLAAPADYKWDANGKLVEKSYVAMIGETKYETLQAAVDAADGATITLLQNVVLESPLTVVAGKSATINGGDFTMSSAGYIAKIAGSLTVAGGSFESGYVAFSVSGEGSSLTVEGGSVMAQEMCVLATKGSAVTISGGSLASRDNAVLSTNGSAGNGGNVITVTGGALVGNIQSAGYIACGIYVANSDTVVVSGGTITVNGGVGILARAGTVSVTGGTITTTGTATGKVGDSKVQVASVPLVFDDQASYPGSADGDRIAVSGGAFSASVPEAYCANGYMPIALENGTYGVVSTPYTATFEQPGYSIVGTTVGTYVTVVRNDGAKMTSDDKANWQYVCDVDTVTATKQGTWGTKLNLLVKRADTRLDTYTVNLSLVRDGHVYATVPISVAPQATLTYERTDKMVEDGPIAVTGLKINGIAVDIADYTITSGDPSIATVVQNGNAVTVTPITAGTVSFTVADKTESALTAPTSGSIFVNAVAKIGDVNYLTIGKAINAAVSGDTIVLCRDTVEQVKYTGKTPRASDFAFTIDLNGHTMSSSGSNPWTLRIDYGTVTIKDTVGGGGISHDTGYAVIVSSVGSTSPHKVIIENGAFHGLTQAIQAGTKTTKYYYGGEVEILGGTFLASVDNPAVDLDANGVMKYLLNKIDSDPKLQLVCPSVITVKGGKFVNFDPANNLAEGIGTDFVAAGYKSMKSDNAYLVVLDDEVIRVPAEEVVTKTAPIVPVKKQWAEKNQIDLGDDPAAALQAKGTNGIPVWQSYVLGLDPKSEASKVKIETAAVNNDQLSVKANVSAEQFRPVKGTTVTYSLKAKKGDTWETIATSETQTFNVPIEQAAGKVLAIFADIVTE